MRPFPSLRWIIALLALTALAPAALADLAAVHPEDHYAVSAYGVEAGLPHNTAPVLCQTSDGYLWIGTEAGLARFDGQRFTVHRTATDPGLAHNLVRHLFEDRSGSLWIGTQRGLSRLRDGRIELVGLQDTPVTALAQDARGRLWIGTGNTGLWELRGDTMISHRIAAGMPTDPDVRSLYADARGQLWVGFRKAGAGTYDGSSYTPLKTPVPLRDAVRITGDREGVVWIGSDVGILRLDGDDMRHFPPEMGLDADPVRDLYLDRHGTAWVATNHLFRLDAALSRFVPISTPRLDNTRAIIQDHEGSLWIGTATDGVGRIRITGVRMAHGGEEKLRQISRTVAAATDGSVFVGVRSSSIVRIRPDGTHESIALPAGAVEAWSVASARDGAVWIGAKRGLHRWRDGSMETVAEFRGVRALFEDSRGRIWIGAESGGLQVWDRGTLTDLTPAFGQPASSLPEDAYVGMAFAEDANGLIYAGLRGRYGIALFRDLVLAGMIDTTHGAPVADIRSILPQPDGTLWVGTKGRGLVVRHRDAWYAAEALSGPLNDQVSVVIEDPFRRIWLGTPRGICWSERENLLAVARGDESALPLHFVGAGLGVESGSVGLGSSPAGTVAPDGTIWLASRNGPVAIDPESVTANTTPPPVVIERVLVDSRPVPRLDTVHLPAGAASLVIDYTAASFVQPQRVAFRHRLQGHDADWVSAGSRRTAFYSNLKPGSYTFQVIACNDDGVWNTTGASLRVEQQPFFHQTRTFWLATTATTLLGMLLVLRWRTSALQWKTANWNAASPNARASSRTRRSRPRPPRRRRACSSRT